MKLFPLEILLTLDNNRTFLRGLSAKGSPNVVNFVSDAVADSEGSQIEMIRSILIGTAKVVEAGIGAMEKSTFVNERAKAYAAAKITLKEMSQFSEELGKSIVLILSQTVLSKP